MADTPESSQRRERAAIAAQACQTCRNRKSKCDEQRPKCGLCRRLNVDCQYREPLPTKKDKTMLYILESLNRLENKFDNLHLAGNLGSPSSSSSGGYRPSSNSNSNSHNNNNSNSNNSSSSNTATAAPDRRARSDGRAFPTQLQQSYQHLTVPHKIILWPSVYIHLINSGIQATNDLQHILQEGTPWFIKQEMQKHPLPLNAEVGLPNFALNHSAREQGFSSRVAFPTLTIQQIQQYSDAFFNTFNVLTPILNRDSFMNETVAPLLHDGYGDGDANSVLALLVCALGQVASEGVFERPLAVLNGVPSGLRGGTVDKPPGLEIFNEARRRLGFLVYQCSLENVQIHLLMATYYEANCRHLDYWRATVAASMACQVLVRCYSIDWSSYFGDLVKRSYWTCILTEDLYHLDLDLPQTGIAALEDEVPMPAFHDGHNPAGSTVMVEEQSHFGYHFLAMIALRRLIARINNVIHEASQAESAEDYGGPPVHVIREMARQLDSWRSLLPRPLQWSDNDRFHFPDSDPTSRRSNEPLFSFDQGSLPVAHKYNLDIVSAQLRTRFYYARFMVYRPFVYKALHFPELMTAEDANFCAMAIKSACLWPICMAPPKNKKRLVPHLFAWTQNFLGILLIFKMTQENRCLKQICDEQVNRDDIARTISLMLEWMRDIKQVDGIAEWSWRILDLLYSGVEV